MVQPLNELSLHNAVEKIACSEITSEELVRSCLVRIEERENLIQAWEHLDPDAAIKQAKAADRRGSSGALHGIPIGIKDIIETVDLPTSYGSPIYKNNRTNSDAACVALARESGAVILGKTVSTEFAGGTPARTRNPHNPAFSPGGSSSGSAAAVADYMVPVAIGSQTVGSTIRPSSFCGVIGFKPSFGTLNLAGVKSQAASMDTLGIISRCITDTSYLFDVLSGKKHIKPVESLPAPPRVGICRTPQWPQAKPETIDALNKTIQCISASNAIVEEVELPEYFDQVLDAQMVILQFEFSQVLTYERTQHRDELSEGLQAILDKAAALSTEDYFNALSIVEKGREMIVSAFTNVEVLITPSASGEAPEFGAPTDLQFQRLWTVLHLPCLTLPAFTGEKGLPVGIQLIGNYRGDKKLLTIAKWLEHQLISA